MKPDDKFLNEFSDLGCKLSDNESVNKFLNEQHGTFHDNRFVELLEQFSDWSMADLRNKLSPVLNLCAMVKNRHNDLYNNSKINDMLESELVKSVDIIKTITRTKEENIKESDISDFQKCIELVKLELTDYELEEDYLQYSSNQTADTVEYYRNFLKLPSDLNWSKGDYVLNVKSGIFYIIDDDGKFIGTSVEMKQNIGQKNEGYYGIFKFEHESF